VLNCTPVDLVVLADNSNKIIALRYFRTCKKKSNTAKGVYFWGNLRFWYKSCLL
jgi:hypothetical protein